MRQRSDAWNHQKPSNHQRTTWQPNNHQKPSKGGHDSESDAAIITEERASPSDAARTVAEPSASALTARRSAAADFCSTTTAPLWSVPGCRCCEIVGYARLPSNWPVAILADGKGGGPFSRAFTLESRGGDSAMVVEGFASRGGCSTAGELTCWPMTPRW